MQSVSSRWAGAIRNTGKRVTKVDVYNSWNGAYGAGTTLLIEDAKVADVSVSIDRSAEARRTASLTIQEASFTALIRSFNPNPMGLLFKIYMGVDYMDGSAPETVPMGVFLIDQIDYRDGDVAVRLELVDQSKVFSRFRKEQPGVLYYPKTLSYNLSIYATLPDYADYNTGFGTTVEPGASEQVADMPQGQQITEPWSWLQLMAARTLDGLGNPVGSELFFGADGDARVTQIKALTSSTTGTDAVWIFRPGDDGDLINAEVSLQMTGFINNVVIRPVLNEATGSMVSGSAWITDVSDPTSPAGPAGWRTKLYDLEPPEADNVTTRALQFLGDAWGVERRITMEVLGNPALDVGDIVGAELSDESIAIQMIESLTIDSSFQMQLQTRGKRLSI